MKCEKSSPTDSVAEVNTQEARVADVNLAKRSATSKGNRLSENPRCVSSTLRAPSCSSACVISSSRAASSVARAAHCAMPASRPCSLSAADNSRSDATSACAASASGVSAASQSGRCVPRRISASAARCFSTAPSSDASAVGAARACSSSWRASRNISSTWRLPKRAPKNCVARSGIWCASSMITASAAPSRSPNPSSFNARSANSR